MPVSLLNKLTDKQTRMCDTICFSSLKKKNQVCLFVLIFRKIWVCFWERNTCVNIIRQVSEEEKNVLRAKRNQKISFKEKNSRASMKAKLVYRLDGWAHKEEVVTISQATYEGTSGWSEIHRFRSQFNTCISWVEKREGGKGRRSFIGFQI